MQNRRKILLYLPKVLNIFYINCYYSYTKNKGNITEQDYEKTMV